MRATTSRSAFVLAVLALTAGAACGGERIPPKQLSDARSEFQQAKTGVAMQLDPTDVHTAELALHDAEQAWSTDPDDPNTIDLAVIAQRKAQIAEAEAAALKAQQDADQAKQQLQATMSSQLNQTQAALNKTQQTLNQTQSDLKRTAQEAEEHGRVGVAVADRAGDDARDGYGQPVV